MNSAIPTILFCRDVTTFSFYITTLYTEAETTLNNQVPIIVSWIENYVGFKEAATTFYDSTTLGTAPYSQYLQVHIWYFDIEKKWPSI